MTKQCALVLPEEVMQVVGPAVGALAAPTALATGVTGLRAVRRRISSMRSAHFPAGQARDTVSGSIEDAGNFVCR